MVAKINKLEEAGMIETNVRRYRDVNFQWVDWQKATYEVWDAH